MKLLRNASHSTDIERKITEKQIWENNEPASVSVFFLLVGRKRSDLHLPSSVSSSHNGFRRPPKICLHRPDGGGHHQARDCIRLCSPCLVRSHPSRRRQFLFQRHPRIVFPGIRIRDHHGRQEQDLFQPSKVEDSHNCCIR